MGTEMDSGGGVEGDEGGEGFEGLNFLGDKGIRVLAFGGEGGVEAGGVEVEVGARVLDRGGRWAEVALMERGWYVRMFAGWVAAKAGKVRTSMFAEVGRGGVVATGVGVGKATVEVVDGREAE